MAIELPVVLDRSSRVPLYHQLAQQLVATIEDGTLQPGDPLENEVELAARLKLSRPTVRRAIAEVVARGLLVRRRGIGTTVSCGLVRRRAELTSLYEDLVAAGRRPRTKVLSLDRGHVDHRAARILGLPEATPLVRLRRLRFSGETPVAILDNWLPPENADLTPAELTEHGLYELLRGRGRHPRLAHQAIGARAPEPAERRLLAVPRNEPLLTMTCRGVDADGRGVEYGEHCYRGGYYAVEFTVEQR